MKVECPYCKEKYDVKQSQLGMEAICCSCNNSFILHVNDKEPKIHKKKFFNGILRKGGLGAIIFAIGAVCFEICTDKVTDEVFDEVDKYSDIREIKTEKIGEFLNNFYGQPVTVVDVTTEKAENKENAYTGSVIFDRKGSLYTRPIEVSFTENEKERVYTYGLDLRKYINQGSCLEEDAEIFFLDLNKTDPELSTLSLVKAKYISPGVVRCTIRTKDGEEFFEDLCFEIKTSMGEETLFYQLKEVK